jgi:hypothetical protein
VRLTVAGRKHADASVDIVIALGGEAGGHCGEVGSIVLWPQVVKQVRRCRCWQRAESAAASRSLPHWRWAPGEHGPARRTVGQVEKTDAIVQRWVQEYLEATNRLDELNAAATV